MPITPDEFLTNQFDDAFAAAVREHHDDKDTPNYDEAHLSLDEMASIPGLPITTYHLPEGTYAESTTSPTLRVSIIDAFHKAIGDKNTGLVQAMVQRGIVSPDVPDINGKTPLADAVRAENLFMAKLLLDLGADRLPDALVRAGTALAALLKKLSLAVWQMIKATPHWVGKQVKAAAKAGRWCGRKIAAAPGAMWRTSKAFAKWTKRRAKDMAAFMLDIGRWLWRCIRAIPSALVIVGNWLKTSTTAIGRALTSLLAQPIALLHTAAMAVISLISRARNVTFRDLLNAFTALISAIIDLPRQIWGALRALHKVALEVVEKVQPSSCPRKLGVILLVAGSSIKKGAHEVAVLINPKF
ncbi:hypothetical protein CcaverHIS002_0206930 [Cutaneotrichosporon cavernicola]|nr:hypothetical protein CcaverHIS002_0206930 [Cutaneotrichosporon cavernicola]